MPPSAANGRGDSGEATTPAQVDVLSTGADVAFLVLQRQRRQVTSQVLPSGGETIVAVINTSPDVVDLLRETFQHAGLATVSAFTFDIRDGRVDMNAFLIANDPRVVVYDIALPYEE